MTFEDISEKFKDKFEEFKGQLEASPAFNTLKEQFENLSPNVQKTLGWAGIALVTLVLVSCPLTYWSASSDNIAKYDETRNMIRDLLRTSHLANQLSGGPEQIPLQTLQSLVQGKLAEARLQPEQVSGVTSIELQELGVSLAPGDILQEALQISLKKLNLRQVVEIGYQMQEIHGTVKLAGIEIAATAENDHYFDVLFKMVKFGLPEAEAGDAPEVDTEAPKTPPRGPRRRGGGAPTEPTEPVEEQ